MTAPASPNSPTRKRIRVEYTADFAQKLDRIIEEQTVLKVSLSELRAGIMPRHEIDAEIEKRVSLTGYLSDRAAIENRLKSLEEAPSATWSRAGVLISGGIGCAALVISCLSIVVMILIASHVIG